MPDIFRGIEVAVKALKYSLNKILKRKANKDINPDGFCGSKTTNYSNSIRIIYTLIIFLIMYLILNAFIQDGVKSYFLFRKESILN